MEEKQVAQAVDGLTHLSVKDGLVDLILSPARTHVLRGVENSIEVLVEVRTGHKEDQLAVQRPPLNLAIVLDKSGSMDSRKKLENAKAAIIEVIHCLGQQDILHLVCYGSKIQTIFEEGRMSDRESLIEQVKGIRAEGGTNLWGGVERGAQLLNKNQHEGYTNWIFLLSDGLVNEGVTDKHTIEKKVAEVYDIHRIQVSAFGLGDDFDEALMRGIAEYGNGTYFFIESADAIADFVNFALKSALQTIAKEAVVKVRGRNAGLVKEFMGGQHDAIKGAFLGDLREDNVRHLLVRLSVRGDVAEDEQEVMTCELSYVTQEGEKETLSTRLNLHFTDDDSLLEKNQNPQVLVKVVLQQAADLGKEFEQVANSYHPDSKKKAIELQEKRLELFKSVLPLDRLLGGKNNIEELIAKNTETLEGLKKAGLTTVFTKEFTNFTYVANRGDGKYTLNDQREGIQLIILHFIRILYGLHVQRSANQLILILIYSLPLAL